MDDDNHKHEVLVAGRGAGSELVRPDTRRETGDVHNSLYQWKTTACSHFSSAWLSEQNVNKVLMSSDIKEPLIFSTAFTSQWQHLHSLLSWHRFCRNCFLYSWREAADAKLSCQHVYQSFTAVEDVHNLFFAFCQFPDAASLNIQ